MTDAFDAERRAAASIVGTTTIGLDLAKRSFRRMVSMSQLFRFEGEPVLAACAAWVPFACREKAQ
jgi:hypothetical protein